MPYVDGFVLPIPTRNRAAYLKMARLGRKVWMEHGALAYHECMADDVQPGKHTSFPQSVKLRKGEEVWFAWVVYKSRRDRDRIMKQVMADPRMQAYDPKNMPFDGKRMFWGGFRMMVSS
jgi:uncharacterized protein YbaA (DUF1428 family)